MAICKACLQPYRTRFGSGQWHQRNDPPGGYCSFDLQGIVPASKQGEQNTLTQVNNASPDDGFDIRNGRNIYEPCPKCRATTGMGLTSRPGSVFVQCDCGHTGPEIEAPTSDQWASWPVPWHERDRLAFEAWNKAAEASRV